MDNLVAINTQKLRAALLIIHDGPEGWYSSGNFINLLTNVQTNVAMGANLSDLRRFLQFINQDIWNIQTIMLRLAWLKDLWNRGQINNGLWMQFAPS
ncbi:MAG: hypothetical protein V3U26_03095, partial [Dehalococcoidia bacterium]